MLVNVLEKWIDLGFYDMDDLYNNVNRIVREMKFIDKDWNKYADKENKEIRKQHIHTFVWCFQYMKKLYWDRTEDLLYRCKRTIEKMKSI